MDNFIQPLYRAQILQQTQYTNNPILKQRKGTLDILKIIIKEQGLKGLFRGSLINTIGSPLSYLIWNPGNIFQPKTDIGNIACLGLATVQSYFIEVIKTRFSIDMGMDGIKWRYNSYFDLIRQIFQMKSFSGICNGLGIQGFIMLNTFTIFDSYFKNCQQYMKQYGFWYIPGIFGLGISFINDIFLYPMITVRNRLIVQQGLPVNEYNGAIDCFKKSWKQHGVQGFYKGYVPYLIATKPLYLCIVYLTGQYNIY